MFDKIGNLDDLIEDKIRLLSNAISISDLIIFGTEINDIQNEVDFNTPLNLFIPNAYLNVISQRLTSRDIPSRLVAMDNGSIKQYGVERYSEFSDENDSRSTLSQMLEVNFYEGLSFNIFTASSSMPSLGGGGNFSSWAERFLNYLSSPLDRIYVTYHMGIRLRQGFGRNFQQSFMGNNLVFSVPEINDLPNNEGLKRVLGHCERYKKGIFIEPE